MTLPAFNMRQLLEAGVHFGHQSHRWNPKMAPFIYGARNNIHIIDLTQTTPMLHQALVKVSDTVAGGGRVLFVATKRQASGSIADCGQARGAVFHQSSLARRHAHQLEDDLPVDPPPAPARRHPRRSAGPHQERGAATHARARQAEQGAGRHQGHGRHARPAVRDRHQQGAASPSRRPRSSAFRSWRSSTPTAIPTASTSRSLATTTPGARSRSTATSSRAPRSTAWSAARRRPASTSAPPRHLRRKRCRASPRNSGHRGSARRGRRPEADHRDHAEDRAAPQRRRRLPLLAARRSRCRADGGARPQAAPQGPDREGRVVGAGEEVRRSHRGVRRAAQSASSSCQPAGAA